MYQDTVAGRGCGLIDPHSLPADDLLRLLVTKGVLASPRVREQLIYVDPARTGYVIPFNVLATQAELQAQGDTADGDIEHARKCLTELDSQRAFYQRQAARGANCSKR